MLKVASFNVQNLFDRAKALNLANWEDARPILEQFASLNALLQKPVYTAADKAKILDKLKQLGLKDNDTGEYVVLRQNRGKLITRPQSGPVKVVASGRDDWIG